MRGCSKETKTHGVSAKHPDEGEFVVSGDAKKLKYSFFKCRHLCWLAQVVEVCAVGFTGVCFTAIPVNLSRLDLLSTLTIPAFWGAF